MEIFREKTTIHGWKTSRHRFYTGEATAMIAAENYSMLPGVEVTLGRTKRGTPEVIVTRKGKFGRKK